MLKYKKNGFIVGIPARDLTDDEVNQFGKKTLLDSGLYAEEVQENTFRKKSKRLESASAEVEDLNNGAGN